jgi:hypothetical protein
MGFIICENVEIHVSKKSIIMRTKEDESLLKESISREIVFKYKFALYISSRKDNEQPDRERHLCSLAIV